MSLHDRFTVIFIMTLVLGLGYLMYDAVSHRANCVQSALSMKYSAAEIKKICR